MKRPSQENNSAINKAVAKRAGQQKTFNFLLLLCMQLALAPWSLQAEGTSRPPAVDDLNALQDLWDPQISPDGVWVAYALTAVDVAADASRSDLWLTRWDGSETVQLTRSAESEHKPRWSPDGKHLAFLSAGAALDSPDQLWLLDISTERKGDDSGGNPASRPRQITTQENGVSDYDWAPDSRRLVLVSNVLPTGQSAGPPDGPIVIDRMLFKRDGYGFLGKERSRLHILDLADNSIFQLSKGPYDEIMPSWSPDGSQIAYVSKLGEDPDRHVNWDILTLEPIPGAEPRRVSEGSYMECDPIWGWNDAGPDWSPDSRQIACIQSGPLEYSWFTLMQLVVFDAQGDEGIQPTALLDRNTTYPRFSSDGQSLYFLLEDNQSVQLASIGLDGSALQKLTPAGRVVEAYDLGSQGKIAVLSSSTDAPAEIFALENGQLRALTHANRDLLASVQMQRAEPMTYAGAEGTELHGLIMKPPGFQPGKSYPTILRLHGGPVSQWQQDFNFGWQVLAAHGYVIFGPNPRGSSGRGEAFQKAIFGDWGNADVPDVLAAVDHLVASGIADASRLGVGGWSAGAMLTNYTIASDTRFKAATSGAGVSNMLAGWGTDEWWHDWEAELGLPWETPENWSRVSYPFLHADRITTPTLFLCGSEDYNVPLIHSEQMYMALRRLGVPSRLVVYPGESHSISRPSMQRDVLQRYLDWYGQWLQ